jgi:DNA-binding transcriptional LysR family regulator
MSDAKPFRLDANLLVALDALLRERNVTRAAASLGLGQPGMSHALARLRQHFGDVLLVRAGGRLSLSPRAQRLEPQVREAMQQLRAVFAPEGAFDPRRSTRTFRIAATDGVAHVLLPALLPRLEREAPGVALHIHPMPQHPVAEDLAAGRVDLAVTYFGELPGSIRRERLFTERYVGLVARSNRRYGIRLTREQYESASHLSVDPRPGAYSRLAALLLERGVHRRLSVVVPHFLLVPGLIARTAHIATLARRLARCFAADYPVRVVTLPFSLPAFEISQIWHERAESDEGLAWLRERIRAAGRARA